MRHAFAASLAATLMLLGSSALSGQNFAYDNSAPVDVAAITPYVTTFSMVGGMEVEWTLANSGGSGVWGDLGNGNWGIWTDDFRLWGAGSGDTWDSRWNLWSTNLISFSINALPGFGVFDVVSSPDQTPGSESGKRFTGWNGYYDEDDIYVTFANPISVGGGAPMLDLYGKMTVEFRGGSWDYDCAVGSLVTKNGQKACETYEYTYVAPSIDYDCDDGYSLFNDNGTMKCRKWKDGRWKYGTIDIDYDCAGSATLVYYNGQKMCKTKEYDYTEPTKEWDAEHFGTSSKCDSSFGPTSDGYYWSGGKKVYYDNEKCYGKYYQDMDNYIPNEPDGPQETVPEPATMTLLATGLAGMAAARRKRKQP